MGWWKDLFRYRDERHELIQLEHELDRNSELFREETAGMKPRSDEYQQLLSKFAHEANFLIARIKEIKTDRALRKAGYWEVAVPSRPFTGEPDTDVWEWDSDHDRYYLTDAALSTIRKETHQEWEMATKPLLSWGAIIISVAALIVSALKP
jgi:hypothetical protein